MGTTTSELLVAARAEALFTSFIPTGTEPDTAEVTQAICTAVRQHCGTRGCAAEVAYAYGERPETAAPRMRWARRTVLSCYPGRSRTGYPAPAQRQPGPPTAG